jgi:HEAT repeat protein
MTRHCALWLVIAAVALAGFAVLIPDSPVYLTKLYSVKDRYGGHSRRYWIENLDNPDARARQEAIFAVGACGAEAGEAVPALAALLLGDSDAAVRAEAALALSKMNPASRTAVPALGQALQDANPGVRMYAALALFRLGGAARSAVPALIQALGDEDNQKSVGTFFFTIRELVALSLGRASAGTAEAVPALVEVLRGNGTVALRHAVVRALGDIGAEARPARPHLRKMLADQRLPLREAAAEALSKIEGERAGGGG